MDISRRYLFKQAAGSMAFLSLLKSTNSVYRQSTDSTGDTQQAEQGGKQHSFHRTNLLYAILYKL